MDPNAATVGKEARRNRKVVSLVIFDSQQSAKYGIQWYKLSKVKLSKWRVQLSPNIDADPGRVRGFKPPLRAAQESCDVLFD